MKITKIFTALAFTLLVTVSAAFGVDAVDRAIANEQNRVAAAANDTALTLDRAAANTGLAADRARAAAAGTGYTADRALDRAENTAANIIPWIIGIALVLGLLYWAMRRSRTSYVPPVDTTHTTGTTVPPNARRTATGSYTHP